MIPATQVLGGLLRSHSHGRMSQSTTPQHISFSENQSIIKKASVQPDDTKDGTPDRSLVKAATDTEISSNPEQGCDVSTSDSQQTWMPSQMLPNTCDLQSLLPSVVAFEERAKEGGNLKESTLKDLVEEQQTQYEAIQWHTA